MLGRYIAGCSAVILFFLIPLKYEAKRYAFSRENTVYEALSKTYAKFKTDGKITAEDISELRRDIAFSGVPYDIEIMIGTLFIGRKDTVINMIYTDEIMNMVEKGEDIKVRGKLVSISAKPLKENYEIKIANLLWDSYIPMNLLTVGGKIHG